MTVKTIISDCLCDVTLSVYPHRAGLKNMPGHDGNRINLRPLEYQPNARPTEVRGQVSSSIRYFGTESSSFNISVI